MQLKKESCLNTETLRVIKYGGSFKEQFGTDSTEMNEETASTKFYFGVLRDFFGL